jgi:hypothetical protein
MSLAGTFLAHTALLGALLTPTDTNQTGIAWAILESSTDDVEAAQQKYGVSIHLKQIGAGTTRALVLTSHDGIQWAVAAASTPLTQPGQEIYEVLEPTRLLRHVAVITVLTGDPKPSHVYAASLLSNGRIRLVRTNKTVDPALAVIDASVTQDSKSGRATVLDGASQVDVGFAIPFANQAYTVAVTPEDEAVSCWVSDRGKLGFRIHTSAPVDGDTKVHWMALHD